MKNLLLLFLIVNFAYGCIPLSADHWEEINKIQSQISIGSTTRGEIISILGKPDVTRDQFILYKSKEYRGGMMFIVIGIYTPTTAITGKVYMDLYFEFDNRGVLKDYRVDKYDPRLNTVE